MNNVMRWAGGVLAACAAGVFILYGAALFLSEVTAGSIDSRTEAMIERLDRIDQKIHELYRIYEGREEKPK